MRLFSTPISLFPSQGFTSFQLKLIAIIAMTIDHIAFAFVSDFTPLAVAMHFIGRLTGPIMFFAAVEGFHHTRNIKRYISRLGIFALISYFPFLLLTSGGVLEDINPLNFNVIFTIFLGVTAIWASRQLKNPLLKLLAVSLLLCLSIPCDWGYGGFLIIILFDFFYGDFRSQSFAYTLTILFILGVAKMVIQPIYSFFFLDEIWWDTETVLICVQNLGTFLPLFFLKHYNGQRGYSGKLGKWLFYIYYPAHILVISGIQYWMMRG